MYGLMVTAKTWLKDAQVDKSHKESAAVSKTIPYIQYSAPYIGCLPFFSGVQMLTV